MTTIRMTKRFILDSLRNEPIERLMENDFILTRWAHRRISVSDPNCASCAVGTVMKRCVAPETKASRLNDKVIDPLTTGTQWGASAVARPSALVATEPWRALSIVYETEAAPSAPEEGPRGVRPARNASLARGRRAAIRFVERHFPSHVELDIDGCAPIKARGVTVVKRRAGR